MIKRLLSILVILNLSVALFSSCRPQGTSSDSTVSDIEYIEVDGEKTYNYLATYGGEDDKPFSSHVERFMLDIGVRKEKIAAIRNNLLE